MGRETKVLLGLLGLLAGVFVGVLSLKLLVPRPPAGAGPDIHTAPSFASDHELVEPPALDPRSWDFTSPPPLAAAPDEPSDPSTVASLDAANPTQTVASPASVAQEPAPLAEPPAQPAPEPVADPFAARAALASSAAADQPAASPSTGQARAPDLLTPPEDAAPMPPALAGTASRFAPPSGPVEPATFAAAPLETAPTDDRRPPVVVPGSSHLVATGDSWWSVAEAAYGDGRFYRALFAWNRALDPKVALLPGTRLEIPPLPRLQAAWPKLLPRE